MLWTIQNFELSRPLFFPKISLPKGSSHSSRRQTNTIEKTTSRKQFARNRLPQRASAHLTVQTHSSLLQGLWARVLILPLQSRKAGIPSWVKSPAGAKLSPRDYSSSEAGEHTQPVQKSLNPTLQSVWGLNW